MKWKIYLKPDTQSNTTHVITKAAGYDSCHNYCEVTTFNSLDNSTEQSPY